jgi:shikimate kinase
MSAQNIFLIGLMAVGKSTVGRRLASVLGRPFVDSDEEIERRAGAAISWIFDVEGESGFRDREQQVIDDLSQREGIVLATGGGVVLRNVNRRRLADRGLVVHLHSPLDRLLARTKNDRNRPLLQSDNPRKVLEELYAQREPLYAEIADLKIMTAQQSVNGLVSHLLKKIKAQSSSD